MTPTPPPPASPTERLQRLEHEVEAAVEQAVAATEASLARRFGAGCVRGLRWTLKVLGVALLVFYFVFGLSLLAARYWLLPRIDQARPWIEARASALLATDLRIGGIEASWRGLDPVLRLSDVRLLGPSGEINLALPRVDATIAWATAPLLWIRFQSLAFEAPELDVRRLADGRYRVAGYTLDPHARGDGGALDWLLSQRRIEIRNARLRYTDESRTGIGREVLFDELDFELRNGLATHRFALRGRPPSDWAGPLDLRGDFTQPLLAAPSQLAQWRGRLFAQADFIDVARVAAYLRLQAADEHIASAQGALRLWADIDETRLTRLTADLALADVDARWSAQTEPLRVRSLQGRLTQREWGNAREGGQQVDLGQLALGGEAGGTSAPIGQLRLRTTRATASTPASGELTVGEIELGAVAKLAPALPLPAGWREPLGRYAVGGRIGEVAAQWQDAGAQQALRYTLKARFDGLRLAVPADTTGASAGAGFANLSGSVELTEAGGTLRLASAGVQIAAPAVFEEPSFALERLDALAQWSVAPRLEVRIESLSLRNADLALSVQGSYGSPTGGGSGAGVIDASGTVQRVAAAAAYRYLPRATGVGVRNWLRDGLRAGQLEDAAFRLRGPLAGFPWPDGQTGEFRVAGQLKDISIDYQAGAERDANGRALPGQVWPVLEGLRGSLVFAGNSMEAKASAARTWGLRTTQVTARIPNMAHNAHLLVRGSGGGPLPDMLRLTKQSPIARWTRNALASASGSGDARFTLDLDVGLTAGAGAKVNGNVVFAGNDLALGGEVPPLANIDGTLRFDERGIAFQGLTAGFLGGRLTADASTRADGAVVIEGNGTATVAAVGTSFDSLLMRRLAAHAQGSLRYGGSLTLGGPVPLLDLRSDLVGVALALPPPLAKPADVALPLRLEHRTPAAGPDEWVVKAGDRLEVQLQRRRDARGELRLTRAAVGINETAALPDSGLRVAAKFERLNAAAWVDLLDELIPEGETPTVPGRRPPALPITARLEAGTLDFEGVTVKAAKIEAARGVDGQWNGTVDSSEAAGTLRWQPGAAGSEALVVARLSRLTLTRSENDGATQALADPRRELPALDVVVEDLQLGPTRYGRLELDAVNTGSGGAARWDLRKLRIANPDATLDATGNWTAAPSGQTMAIKLGLDIADGGALLARLGMPGVLRHAAGRIQGDISWRGPPTHLDLASLDGTLALDLKQGQFLKADPGAARLLSLISLQALARTATLDFSSFDSGFAFTSILANAALAAGTITTRDFKMIGPAAAVLLDGSVDLRRETQNLRLLVLPDVGLDSASLLYAAVVNPAVGLGTFLAQLLLRDPLSKLFSVEYAVTGTWSEPAIQRIERSAPPPVTPPAQ